MTFAQILKAIAKFVLALFAVTILCTFAWQLVAAQLYDCTDDGFLGYWRPGNWVHSWDDHAVEIVQQVIHGRSMSEPDTIKAGWSVKGLWCLWWLFVGVSIGVSVVLAKTRWSLTGLGGRVHAVDP
jgi:hypothetical protein